MSQDFKQAALDYHAEPKPGKVGLELTTASETQDDLALAYSPGVAEPVKEIAKNPAEAYRYTAKGNLVAVITNVSCGGRLPDTNQESSASRVNWVSSKARLLSTEVTSSKDQRGFSASFFRAAIFASTSKDGRRSSSCGSRRLRASLSFEHFPFMRFRTIKTILLP